MAKISSPIFQDMSGRLGPVVLKQTRYGAQMVGRQKPADPDTPAQKVVRSNFARASHVWNSMTLAQSNAWRDFAWANGLSSPTHGPTTFNVFMSFALRFLLANGTQAVVPLTPPAAPFGGDDVRVTLAGGANQVILDVLRGNSPGVVTEVLFQPLASIHRATYLEKYRSQAFVTAVAGVPIVLPARPGVVAVAIRMVESATGQATSILELSRVVVQ